MLRLVVFCLLYFFNVTLFYGGFDGSSPNLVLETFDVSFSVQYYKVMKSETDETVFATIRGWAKPHFKMGRKSFNDRGMTRRFRVRGYYQAIPPGDRTT